MKPTKSPNLKLKAESTPVRLFHKTAVLMVLTGAASSVGFTLYTGRNNNSIVLIVLFVGWVLAPYITLLLVNVVARRWSLPERLALYGVMLFITLGSFLMYSGLGAPPGVKPAFVFLIVPLLSWFVMGISVLIAAFQPNRT